MIITIIGQHTENYGDDAAGLTLIQKLLKYPKVVQINVLYKRAYDKPLPVEDSRVVHYNDLNVLRNPKEHMWTFFMCYRFTKILPLFSPFGSMRKIIHILKKSDQVIISPCGANIGIYHDDSFLSTILLAIKCGKKPIFHFNTIGESGIDSFDKMARWALKRCEVFVREKTSHKYLKSIGIYSQFGVDTAFEFLNPHEIGGYCENKERVVSVICNPERAHQVYQDYNVDLEIANNIVVPLVQFCKEHNLKMQFISHLPMQKAIDFCGSLSTLANAICEGISIRRDDITSVFAYDEAIHNSYMVVSSRYHGCVFAAKYNIPFVAISYEHKMEEVAGYTNCKEQIVGIKEVFDGKSILPYCENVWNSYEEIKNKLVAFNQSELRLNSANPFINLEGERGERKNNGRK